MKKSLQYLLCLIAGSLSTQAASFEKASQYLDTDGSLIGYINFEGDGTEIGNELNAIYADAVATIPGMMALPLDFPALFDTLGFGSLEAIALSSKELDDGLHANRSVTLFSGAPSGLMAMYGTPDTPTVPFRAAELAPADASGAISGRIDLTALRDTVSQLVVQVMGPMGESMVAQQLQQPIPGTTVTVNQTIEGLSGHWDVFWKESYDANFTPSYQGWLRIRGAVDVVEQLRPLMANPQMGVSVAETDNGIVANLSALTTAQGFSLFIETNRAEDVVLIYSDKDWGPNSAGPRLNTTEAYQALAKRLPKQALIYSYTTGYDMNTVMAALKAEPQFAPYAGLAEKVVDLFLSDFLEPTIGAMYFDEDVLISESYAGYSTKQALMMIPAAVGGGLGAAMAIPAFQKVRENSQEKAVTNNLRQIAAAAQQYFLETGETEVKIETLIGPNGYIRSLEPVAGESYDGMVISIDDETIQVTLGDGSVIVHTF